MNTDARLTAKLLSACPPDSAQKEKLEDVLSKKYGKAVELVWQEDRTAQGGFRIELGSEVIDWTAEGRLEQLKERLTGLKSEGSVIPLIRDAVKSWVPEVCAREMGSVLTVADGIAYVNLGEQFVDEALPVDAQIPVYSIVNSLIAAGNVSQVQISINGDTSLVFKDEVDMNQLFQVNHELEKGGED